MPQFEPVFFASQILWTLVSFAVLFYALNRWVLPRITHIMQQRIQLIEDEIEQARHQHAEAEKIKQAYEAQLATIDQEAKRLFNTSNQRLIDQRRRMMQQWQDQMARDKRQLQDDIKLARQQAMHQVRTELADIIVSATDKLIHQQLDTPTAQKALDESLDELKKHLN
ncbi:MAG: hypothetical protein CO186_11000 [Zetaproteobacteria bacterium CG_4_9_14_3_um_filter_49_83]|nr:MAG: hypothetical protein AUJ56_01075 [Zetaproteobacteria bacterium CG1_02_49_23]PIQ30604.1 MAG: hypothetical protein COW62_11985 [Zetaproteobacteria bacterium CG17_big_fil_post_rev_8_21_14_2_50_50_13]PIV30655.1 MAG: hypothetical protein COS35_05605 [Zetaproteobacteria bacterium CG02_land_8_20_14_3_00_50_9]PIY55841.1 MAG: hypothetical protein COZ00_07380 [Zetaproteobacteria bacterium CG_4_10_14_0_8_um_filter_49_80]PJA34355.1 MAG: hypothetical protein CO186_11000 [Zetaproteobacteria bacterium